MSDRFWVGGSGNWSDNTNHWASVSGGAPGASLPGSTDDCHFDVNSFTAGNRTVTFNVSPDVKSMDFTGATNNPIVAPTNSCTIRGNLTLISGMAWGDAGSTITFVTTGTTANLTTGGVRLGVANVIISGSGTFNLQDDLIINNFNSSGNFKPSGSGTINTNNHNMTVLAFQGQGGSTDTINLGSSTITLNDNNGGVTAWALIAGETLNAGTSKIVIAAPNDSFVGAGKTYYDISVTVTGVIINSSNTFHSITINAGLIIKWTASTTQTITTLNAVGTSGSHILFRSTMTGTQASLCVTNWNIAYVDAEDMNASCTAISDCTGINSGNNSHWDFCMGRAFLLNLL